MALGSAAPPQRRRGGDVVEGGLPVRLRRPGMPPASCRGGLWRRSGFGPPPEYASDLVGFALGAAFASVDQPVVGEQAGGRVAGVDPVGPPVGGSVPTRPVTWV